MKIIRPLFCTGLDEGWHYEVNFTSFGPFRTKADMTLTTVEVAKRLS